MSDLEYFATVISNFVNASVHEALKKKKLNLDQKVKHILEVNGVFTV